MRLPSDDASRKPFLDPVDEQWSGLELRYHTRQVARLLLDLALRRKLAAIVRQSFVGFAVSGRRS
jgi:hypothetical protein